MSNEQAQGQSELQAEAQALAYQASELSQMGRHDEALAKLTQLQALVGENAKVSAAVAEVLLAAGRPADAEAWARIALDLDSSSNEGFTQLCVALLTQNRAEEALPNALRNRELYPDEPGSHIVLGLCYAHLPWATGEFKNLAGASAFEALRLSHNSDTIVAAASIFAQIGDRKQALELAEQGLLHDPTNPALLSIKGNQGKTKSRAAIFSRLLADYPLEEATRIRLEIDLLKIRRRQVSMMLWFLVLVLLAASVTGGVFFWVFLGVIAAGAVVVGQNDHKLVGTFAPAFVKANDRRVRWLPLFASRWMWFYPVAAVLAMLLHVHVFAAIFVVPFLLVAFVIVHECRVSAELSLARDQFAVSGVLISMSQRSMWLGLAAYAFVVFPAMFTSFQYFPGSAAIVALGLIGATAVITYFFDFRRGLLQTVSRSHELGHNLGLPSPDEVKSIFRSMGPLVFIPTLYVAAMTIAYGLSEAAGKPW